MDEMAGNVGPLLLGKGEQVGGGDGRGAVEGLLISSGCKVV
jgi:hypothetical protein